MSGHGDKLQMGLGSADPNRQHADNALHPGRAAL
jgi:hypothetical protein